MVAKHRQSKKRGSRKLPKAKKESETKLVKQILPSADNPTFTTAHTHNTPYFSDIPSLADSFNFTLTKGGTSATDHHVKDFILNGTGMNNRIGRQVTIMNARSKLILEIKHVTGATSDSTPLQFRIIQGWVKEGIDNFMALTTEVNSLYSEVNWNKYRVLKDYIVNRRPLANGLPSSGGNIVSSYKPIVINSVWSPNRVLKWDKDTTPAGQVPCQYMGYAPFLLIFNSEAANYHLETKFYKRTISFKDL